MLCASMPFILETKFTYLFRLNIFENTTYIYFERLEPTSTTTTMMMKKKKTPTTIFYTSIQHRTASCENVFVCVYTLV